MGVPRGTRLVFELLTIGRRYRNLIPNLSLSTLSHQFILMIWHRHQESKCHSLFLFSVGDDIDILASLWLFSVKLQIEWTRIVGCPFWGKYNIILLLKSFKNRLISSINANVVFEFLENSVHLQLKYTGE